MIAKKYISLILFFFFFATALGQDYIEQVIPFQNNGESKVVNKIIRFDSKGFLWYNVLNGFVRYSGNTNQLFKSDASKNRDNSQGHVQDFLVSTNNKLVAATQKGILILNLTTGEEKWLQPKHSNGKYLGFFSLKVDTTTNLVWLSTYTGELFSLSLINEELIKYKYLDRTFNIKLITNGYLITAESFKNIVAIKIPEANKPIQHFKLDSLFKKNNYIKVTKNGAVMPKNESGYYNYNGVNYSYKTLHKYGCQLIEIPNESNLFKINTAKTNNKSPQLLLFSGASIKEHSIEVLDSKKYLKPKKNGVIINNPLKDQFVYNTNVYVFDQTVFATTEKGIVKLKPKEIPFKKELVRNNKQIGLRTIEQFDDKIIALTYDGFYSKSKNNKFEELKIIDQDGTPLKEKLKRLIYGFYKKNDSILYTYGFFGNSIYRVNIKTKRSKKIILKLSDFKSNASLAITDIKNYKNTLYFATSKGLYSFKEKDFTYQEPNILISENQLNPTLNIKNTSIENLCFDNQQQNLWIGTVANGLYKKNLKTNSVDFFTKENKRLSHNNITDIYNDTEGNIWVGTLDGLNKINNDGITTFFNQSNGLQNTNITKIKESENHIWVATYNGLASLNKKTEKINFLYKEDGLTDNEFNKKSAFKTKDGNLYFGTINGVVSFNPNDFSSINKNPKINLLSVSKYNTETEEKEKIIYGLEKTPKLELPLGKNYLSLEVGIENFNQYKDVVYKYQLDDNPWNEMDKNVLTLQGLASGNHTIKINGVSMSGDKTDTLEFVVTVETIFYKRPLFIILIALFFIILLLLYSILKKEQLKKIHEKDLIELNLKSKLSLSLMSPHFIFNILTGLQATRLIKDAKKANQSFNNYSNILRETLNMCHKEEITILNELDYIKQYIALENMMIDPEIKLTIKISDLVKPDEFKIPTMMIQPIIENSIHHGLANKIDEKEIKISFSKVNNFLVVKIVDNGQGRNKNIKSKSEKSWATDIIKNRMQISSQLGRKMSMDIIDLKGKKGKNLGTKVVLKFCYS